MGRAAGHEEEDDPLRFGRELRRLDRERIARRRARRKRAAKGVFVEKAGEPQQAEPIRELAEHLTPRHGRDGGGIQVGETHGSIKVGELVRAKKDLAISFPSQVIAAGHGP